MVVPDPIRVLHYEDPDDARRRLDFLGVSPPDAARLGAELRPYLVRVPRESGSYSTLQAHLAGAEIPVAFGRGALFFSVSSPERIACLSAASDDARDAWTPLLDAIDRVCARTFDIPCRDRILRLDASPRIMGILNVTPDSFSDGGRFLSAEDAVRQGLAMADEGAHVLDVGGESTRPGSRAVPPEEESARVIPVIRELAGKTDALLSVDTTKADVARRAVEAGARIINDTSALSDDPEMAAVVRESGCAVVLMHRKGTPETMQLSPRYESVLDEVLDALSARIEAARQAGIPVERILVDPGIGFGKKLEHNLALHRRLPDLSNLGRPIVFGPSRKAFLGAITGRAPAERIFGTAASIAWAARGGAHILRVHDVKEMKEVVAVTAAIQEGPEC